MTESELNEIEPRLNYSTKGNWIPMIEGITHESSSDFIMTNVKNNDDYNNPKRGQDIELNSGTKDDIVFIGKATQDIRKMITESTPKTHTIKKVSFGDIFSFRSGLIY